MRNMSQKRQQQEDAKPRSDGNFSEEKRPRNSFRSVVQDVMYLRKMQNCMEPILEPLIRKVVKEEVEIALRKYVISMKRSGKEIHPCESRLLVLQFLNSIALPVFTGTRIEGEDFSSLGVALVDGFTRQIVSDGPESSAKVEIVVLEGDFDGDEGHNWTSEEFTNNIVREREGKKPLLTGDAFVNLKDGIGSVGDISFTDNSSWTRSRKFRLGARVVDKFDRIIIREAKTESFVVRDHRGELYKKHHPPSLHDEVWRLEKIGKDGAFHKRLSKERINTVKDFLALFFLDPARLRNILGTGMSAKMWEVTVDHAQTCILDKKLYSYYPPGTQQKIGVIFTVVGQVTGLVSDGIYIPADKLSETEKVEAQNLVLSAFRNWDGVVCQDDDSACMDVSSQLSAAQCSSNSPIMGNLDYGEVLASQNTRGTDCPQLGASSPDIMQSMDMESLSHLDYYLPGIDSLDLRFEQPTSFPGQITDTLMSDPIPVNHAFTGDEHLKYFDSECSLNNSGFESSADLHAVTSFLSRSTVSVDKAHRRWRMLFNVFRVFSVRRTASKKKRPY